MTLEERWNNLWVVVVLSIQAPAFILGLALLVTLEGAPNLPIAKSVHVSIVFDSADPFPVLHRNNPSFEVVVANCSSTSVNLWWPSYADDSSGPAWKSVVPELIEPDGQVVKLQRTGFGANSGIGGVPDVVQPGRMQQHHVNLAQFALNGVPVTQLLFPEHGERKVLLRVLYQQLPGPMLAKENHLWSGEAVSITYTVRLSSD